MISTRQNRLNRATARLEALSPSRFSLAATPLSTPPTERCYALQQTLRQDRTFAPGLQRARSKPK